MQIQVHMMLTKKLLIMMKIFENVNNQESLTESNTSIKNNPENLIEGKINSYKSPPQSVTASIIPVIKNTQYLVPWHDQCICSKKCNYSKETRGT